MMDFFRLREKWILIGALGLLIVLIVWLVADTLAVVQYNAAVDEGYYLKYAVIVGKDGLSSFPALFRDYLDNSQHQLFPSPVRVGFISIAAGWCRLFGPSFLALSWLSLCAHLCLVVTTFVFARRHFDALWAFLLAALCGFSPILLALSRRALSDSMATLTMALAIWLFLDILVRNSRWLGKVAFAAAFGLAVLVKESSCLLVVPFIVSWLIARNARRSLLSVRNVIVLFSASLAGCLLIVMLAAGGVSPLVQLVTIILSSPATNNYVTAFCSGPLYRYILDFVTMSPWVMISAIVFVGVLVTRWRGGQLPLVHIYFLVMFAALLLCFAPFPRNFRYLAVLEIPVRLFALAMLFELGSWVTAQRTTILVGLTVAIICWMDYCTFERLFVVEGIYDPVSFKLLCAQGIIPCR